MGWFGKNSNEKNDQGESVYTYDIYGDEDQVISEISVTASSPQEAILLVTEQMPANSRSELREPRGFFGRLFG